MRELSLHPVHLTPDKEGNLPPSALVPFCSYQRNSSLLGQERPELDNLTICDKFKTTILDGQLCYSLDIAKLDEKGFADSLSKAELEEVQEIGPVSYTHLTLPTTPYV